MLCMLGNLGIHVDATLTCTAYINTGAHHMHPLWQQQSLMAATSYSWKTHCARVQKKKMLGKGLRIIINGLRHLSEVLWSPCLGGQSCFCITMDTYTILRQVVAVYSDGCESPSLCRDTLPPSKILCTKEFHHVANVHLMQDKEITLYE